MKHLILIEKWYRRRGAPGIPFEDTPMSTSAQRLPGGGANGSRLAPASPHGPGETASTPGTDVGSADLESDTSVPETWGRDAVAFLLEY